MQRTYVIYKTRYVTAPTCHINETASDPCWLDCELGHSFDERAPVRIAPSLGYERYARLPFKGARTGSKLHTAGGITISTIYHRRYVDLRWHQYHQSCLSYRNHHRRDWP